jgi:hypothetical protein
VRIVGRWCKVSDYPKFGSIPRRYRDITITEKIDGTNGLICISKIGDDFALNRDAIVVNGAGYNIDAGSRTRWLSVGTHDNYGFAKWVEDNTETLIADLGEGMHYGEWWGYGIQRGYGLKEKRFSLFNTGRWGIPELTGFLTPNLHVVPTLSHGVPNTDEEINRALDLLRAHGSFGDFGGEKYMNPEGIVIWHEQGRFYEKITLENDGLPKGLVK